MIPAYNATDNLNLKPFTFLAHFIPTIYKNDSPFQ